MAEQAELFPDPEVSIILNKARHEPRLWVSRLVIWEKPGEMIREVRLRRGLTIIWSPDPGAGQAELGRDAGSGHGAGKTLFCRLLRYCLGEDAFSNDEQRRSIAERLPAGLVGAELVIDGKPWALIRPIGLTRKHLAREGATLEDLAPMKEPGGSIQPLLDALNSTLFPKGIECFLPAERENTAWLFALAWLSRDQECRFDHILDWRHRRADTGSVAIGPTKDQLLVVVRAFLGIIGQEEALRKTEREQIAEKKRAQERDIAFYQRQSNQRSTEIMEALELDQATVGSDELGLAILGDAAEKRLEESKKLDISGESSSLESSRQQRETTLKEMAVLESDITRFNATRELHDQQLKALRGERSYLVANEIIARLGPSCPVCLVPIEQAMTEGCKLSNQPWDPTKVQSDKDRIAEQLKACDGAIKRANQFIAEHTIQLQGLQQQEAKLAKEIDALDKKIEEAKSRQRQKEFSAKQLVGKVSSQKLALESINKTKKTLEDLVREDERIANLEAKLRSQHSAALLRLREIFSYVCKCLLGNQVKASLILSGQGLQADVEVGGMAMESLKAVAFDLAAMLMSIEGHSLLPAFLVHDSPREADLGEAIYHRLFRLVRSCERLGDDPPFQYIITTTSRPPDDYCQLPFLVAELQGSNAEERLLRQNLGGSAT
jgi:hypothetical protein